MEQGSHDRTPRRHTAPPRLACSRRWGSVAIAFGGIAVLGLLGACDRAPLEWRFAGPTMGTSYTVIVLDPPPGNRRTQLAEAIRSRLAVSVRQMSTYDPDSELSRFNRYRGTDWFPVSLELAEVVAESLELTRSSGGAFDVSVGPLVRLWGFGPSDPRTVPPPAPEVAAARLELGRTEVRIRPPGLRKQHPLIALDLSAIAKGDAVDRIAAYLERRGIGRYLVEIGGEIRARGPAAETAYWRIAIERPEPGARSAQTVLHIDAGAVATSGDYRNYFEADGRRYGHVIDPATGRPTAHDAASVTVVAARARHADGLATALLVLGPERGLALAEREGVAAYFLVRSEGELRARHSTRMRRHLSPPPGGLREAR